MRLLTVALLLAALGGCEAGELPVEAEPVAPARNAVSPPVPMRAAAERQAQQQVAPAAAQPHGASCCGSSECQQAGGGCGCRARGVRCGG